MTAAERLAALLPEDVILLILAELPRVTHPGLTTIVLQHGPGGRITEAQVQAAAPRVKVGR